MEYWFFPKHDDKEYINKCLDCQLYSATNYEKVDHFTKPRIIKDIQGDSIFEAVEALQCLDHAKKWIINPLDINNNTSFELIKQVIKNKDQLPHIELNPIVKLDENREKNIIAMQEVITCMSYGTDYIFLHSAGIINGFVESVLWLDKFRTKGRYKTKFMISDQNHLHFMDMGAEPCYDGVCYIVNDIIHGTKK